MCESIIGVCIGSEVADSWYVIVMWEFMVNGLKDNSGKPWTFCFYVYRLMFICAWDRMDVPQVAICSLIWDGFPLVDKRYSVLWTCFFSPQHFLFFFSPQIYFGDATGEHLYGRVMELTVKHSFRQSYGPTYYELWQSVLAEWKYL